MRAAALLGSGLALAGCGRVGFDPADRPAPRDAATSADAPGRPDGAVPTDAPACTTFTAWSPPVRIAELSSAGTEYGPSVSRDGLEIVFASDRSGSFLLYDATRAAVGDAWSAPVALTAFPAGAQDPSLSSDRLELYWGAAGGVDHAERASLTSEWTNLTAVLTDANGYSAVGGPDISRDGRSLVFTATATSTKLWGEYVTTRAQLTDAFGPGTPIPGVAIMGGDGFGSLGAGGRELVEESEQGTSALFSAARTTATGSFGAPVAIAELTSGAGEVDPDLSDDGLTLTFSSARSGGLDLYTSTRTCE